MAYTGNLSPADLERVAADRAMWMAVGLSTERCDRPAAEEAVAAAYATAGLPRPAFVWMDSPLGGVFAAAVLRNGLPKAKRGQLRDQLWGQLGGQLGDQLRDQLRGQLRDELGG